MNHYTDLFFNLQRQQMQRGLINSLKQNSFEEAEKLLAELRSKHGDSSEGKDGPKKGKSKGKGRGREKAEVKRPRPKIPLRLLKLRRISGRGMTSGCRS